MTRLALLLLALVAAACAGPQLLSSSFPIGGPQLEAALAQARSGGQAASAPRSVVVGVSAAPRAVFAYDLGARRLLFQVPSQAIAVPRLAGELVVVAEPGQLAILRLRDGSLVQRFASDGMQLVGAEGDGSVAAIALATSGPMRVRSRLLLLRGERVTSDQRLERTLGAPAVLGGVAFVPHNRVHLSLLTPEGRELARVRIRADVAAEAFVQQGEVYFGQRGVYLLDRQTDRGPADGARYFRPELTRKLPGAPPLLAAAERASLPPESAVHRVALAFAPLPGDGPAGLKLSENAVYLAFYRQLFALLPDASSAHWVRTTASDVVGMRAVVGGLLTVESAGAVLGYDGSGQLRFRHELGVLPVAARVYAQALEPGAARDDPPPLADQLEHAAREPDTRLVPAQVLATSLLGAVEDDRAARALIGLCTAPLASQPIRNSACETLAARTLPSDALLEALLQSADYLEGRAPPPVAVLAQALLSSGDRRGSEGLRLQLRDPATPSEALAPLLRALATFAEEANVAEVARFLRLYHADPSDELFEAALAAAMDALVQLDRARARPVLEEVANDAFARVGVRAAARSRLDALGADPASANEGEPPPSGDEVTTSDSVTAGSEAPALGPPVHLTTQHVDEALAQVRKELTRCVHEARERPASARLVIVISGEGQVTDVRALPASVEPCVAPLVRAATFPSTKYGRRSVMSYTVPR